MLRPTFAGLEIGRSSLQLHQLKLDMTGHNIANVNTRGFTRQRMVATAWDPGHTIGRAAPIGQALVGGGSRVLIHDQIRLAHLDRQFRTVNTEASYWNERSAGLRNVEGRFDGVNHETTLNYSVQRFFSAVNTLSHDSVLGAARADVRNSGIGLTQQLNLLYNSLLDMQRDHNQRIVPFVDSINNILQGIAELNRSIYAFEVTGHKANDLRDKRNVLLDDLSSIIDIRYEDVPDGFGRSFLHVEIGGPGNWQTAVSHVYYTRLGHRDMTDPGDGSHLLYNRDVRVEIYWQSLNRVNHGVIDEDYLIDGGIARITNVLPTRASADGVADIFERMSDSPQGIVAWRQAQIEAGNNAVEAWLAAGNDEPPRRIMMTNPALAAWDAANPEPETTIANPAHATWAANRLEVLPEDLAAWDAENPEPAATIPNPAHATWLARRPPAETMQANPAHAAWIIARDTVRSDAEDAVPAPIAPPISEGVLFVDTLGVEGVPRGLAVGGQLQAELEMRDNSYVGRSTTGQERKGVPHFIHMINDLARVLVQEVNNIHREGWTLPFHGVASQTNVCFFEMWVPDPNDPTNPTLGTVVRVNNDGPIVDDADVDVAGVVAAIVAADGSATAVSAADTAAITAAITAAAQVAIRATIRGNVGIEAGAAPDRQTITADSPGVDFAIARALATAGLDPADPNFDADVAAITQSVIDAVNDAYTTVLDDADVEVNVFEAAEALTQITAGNIRISSAVGLNEANIAAALRTITPEGIPEEGQAGNNQNMLRLHNLFISINDIGINVIDRDDANQTQSRFIGSVDSYTTRIRLDLANAVNQSNTRADTVARLTLDTENQRQAVAGVSLDEEMAHMIRFQHAYQGAARVITAMDEALDRLINGTGRVGL